MLLSDAEKATLAEIAHRLGRKALEGLAAAAKPDTLPAWYQKPIAHKFDGSKYRKTRGRRRAEENNRKYLLRDRDRKYCQGFREVLRTGGIEPIALPARSPNLNAYAERWVRSVKEECLSKLILLGEDSLRRGLRHYEDHYHGERNHQGKDNLLLFPLQTPAVPGKQQQVRCRERLAAC